jgi:hypothetical protein
MSKTPTKCCVADPKVSDIVSETQKSSIADPDSSSAHADRVESFDADSDQSYNYRKVTKFLCCMT